MVTGTTCRRELLYRANLQVLAGDFCSAVDLHVLRSGGLLGADQGVVDPSVTKMDDVPPRLTIASGAGG